MGRDGFCNDADMNISNPVNASVKRAWEAAAESELCFLSFLEHLPLMVAIKDGQGRVLFANEYMEDMLDAGDLAGKRTEELFPPERAAQISEDDRRALTEGLLLVQDIISDSDGDEHIFETYKFPLPPAGGTSLLGCVSVDVTERKRAEDALAVKQQQLEELNRSLEQRVSQSVDELRRKDQMLLQQSRHAAMGEMIHNIAHQWRQPLNNIGLIIQNMQLQYEAGEMNPEQMAADVNNAMEVISYMSRTIDDFRNFFRQDKERHIFIVNRMVSRSLDFFSPTLKSCGISVEFQQQPDIIADGYPSEYMQALLNILSNAKDELLERKVADPLISINLFSENQRSVVTIRDNAGGIAEDVLPKIFDPYFTTKEQGKGSGIGLYMSKTIIEKNINGRLSVRNVEGGVEFRIEV